MKYTISDFYKDYPTDDACLDKILEMRYGKEPVCPKCKKTTKFHRVRSRKQYACQYCGYQIAPCAGTIFEKSRTSLRDWFYAMYLFTSTRHGVPAKELERQLGVTYKTAWRMGHQLRKLMAQTDGEQVFNNHVEMDETYVGGKKLGAGRGHARLTKTTVFGIVQREGEVHAEVVSDTLRSTLQPIIDRHVPWGLTISTDENAAYKHLGGISYNHGAVRHRRKEWKVGIHHPNSIEGFWSRLKNSIRGTHIHVSPKHMNKYLDEFSYRYNNRQAPNLMFNKLVAGLAKPVVKH